MKFILLFLASVFLTVSNATQKIFTLSCKDYPGPCNNDCYAIFTAKAEDTLTRDRGGKTTTKREAAGCLNKPNKPCVKGGGMAMPSEADSSCDEYPYASTKQGGKPGKSILRCTKVSENSLEGSILGNFFAEQCKDEPNCEFSVAFSNTEYAHFCTSKDSQKNDGFEYVYEGKPGKYKLAPGSKFRFFRRMTAPGWKLHEPNPKDYFPLHHRREFLLENGATTMLLSRDVNTSFNDASVYYQVNNTLHETRIVRELHGMDKSPMFRL